MTTLSKVTDGDFLSFKECLDTFMNWYRMNSDRIRAISEAWLETEDDTITSILSRGLSSLQAQTEIMQEADSQ